MNIAAFIRLTIDKQLSGRALTELRRFFYGKVRQKAGHTKELEIPVEPSEHKSFAIATAFFVALVEGVYTDDNASIRKLAIELEVS